MSLYTDLAHVYDYIYSQLFDYDGEAQFYHYMMSSFNCKSICEFGCGTGHLSSRFEHLGYDYIGIDISDEMVRLARGKNPDLSFETGDICNYTDNLCYDAVLFTGRAMSYLVSDEQISLCFQNVRKMLKKGGLFIFDAIDGPILFKEFDISEQLIKIEPYTRISRSKPHDVSKYIWQWHGDYFDDQTFIGSDDAILRAFSPEFINIASLENNLIIIQKTRKKSYAWQDNFYVLMAV